jgi:molybdate-binding protein/DNA-binding XRE family transcriptional regulator
MHRRRKGWTQEELARRLGLRRQAVYDLESGRHLPNTATALALADLFACSVENLFVPRRREKDSPVRTLEDSPPSPGSRLAVAAIRDELVAVPLDAFPRQGFILPPADAFVDTVSGKIVMTASREALRQTLFLPGCHPALDILEAHIRRDLPSVRVRRLFASSGKALSLLAGGAAHAAAIHYHSDTGTRANAAAARKALPGTGHFVIGFAVNEEGLMVAKGNPLGIRSVADLARPNARMVNREAGAALRALFDARMRKEGVPATAIGGYDTLVASHYEGALRIACGAADAALGLRGVAESLGLSFVPLTVTRCDLVIPGDMLALPAMACLGDALNSSRLHRELAGIPGFDASMTGREMGLSARIPAQSASR